MTEHAMLRVARAALLVWAFSGPVGAREGNDEDSSKVPSASKTTESEDMKLPFLTRIEIDTRQPVSYGDDVNISIWITPREAINFDQVKIYPKGGLAAIYISKESVPAELRDKGEKEFEDGVACRTTEVSPRPHVPFVVTCALENRQTGWRKWLDPEILQDSGLHKFEIEITLLDERGSPVSFHEIGSIEFASPKVAVVFGGFLGSLILSFLTFASRPVDPAPTAGTWKEFGKKLWKSSPQLLTSMTYGCWDILRRALLGGVTAMVLIILAKSSEGFESPISLRIQDFWGGLLVGLVSVNLAHWVLNKLNKLIK